jgi:hypothetical protein
MDDSLPNESTPGETSEEIVEFDVPTDFGPLPAPLHPDETEPDAETSRIVEVRRRAGLSALLGVVAGGVATAYLSRAVDSGSTLDWALCLLMATVAVANLAALLDARAPLVVADEHGVRLRLGRSWTGLPWGALRRVEVTNRRGLRDGRLAPVPRNAPRLLEELEPGARRAAWLAARLHGAPFAVPLTLASRVSGTDDVEATLRELVAGRTEVVTGFVDEPEDIPEPGGADEAGPHGGRWTHPGPAIAHAISTVAAHLRSRPDVDTPVNDPIDDPVDDPAAGSGDPVVLPEPVVASATPSPLRQLVPGLRAEVRADRHGNLVAGANALKADTDEDSVARGLPEGPELRRPGSVDVELDDEEWSAYGERVRPIALPGPALETVVIDDFAIEPADEPVIGPAFAAARTRLGLSVDQLAERTRIRPHVIESIEVDDFLPCGGDFYARGHIRTLARILGVDAAPLLASYDERYADAPVNARRVFEAELAHSGGIRATRGGPNWSVLVAAVMALVLAWSVARLVMDGPVDLGDQPVLNGSGGPNNHAQVPVAPAVPVVIAAPASGARVIVRDGSGSVVFTGDIAFGATKTLSVSPPVRIQSTDGSVTVSVDGESRGALGKLGVPGSGTYVAH